MRINNNLALLIVTVACFMQTARAELKPEEIAIIAVRASRQSQDVARHYAEKRNIPLSHIFSIDVAAGKNLDRQRWELMVRPAIRNWMIQQQLETKIRCLVTVWDVPLKIGKTPSEAIEARIAFLETDRHLRARRLVDLLAEIHSVLPDEDPPTESQLDENASAKQLADALNSSFDVARRRMALANQEDRAAANVQLLRAVATSGGVAASFKIMIGQQPQKTPQAKVELAQRIELAKGRLLGLRDAKQALDRMPDSVERDEQIINIVTTAEGLLGSILWIDGQLSLLKKNETYTSFDSELSLLFWLRYPLNRWRPNLLNYRYDGSQQRDRALTLMVSRLEAPTFELTTKLIDTAIEVEQIGLLGKVYLDARGIAGSTQTKSRGSYGEYDQALRELSALLKERTELTVTLDDKKALFQPGDCPQTGLYCGWYSLAKYVDAFDFQPGAVAYHIASSEATTLRNPKSQVWCKRMLEDGVCATLGPVHEPYLAAFPRPDEFFVALLSGRYTLVESYYRTKPYNSWVMVLIGDPLYNPYRAMPLITRDALPPSLQNIIEPSPAATDQEQQ